MNINVPILRIVDSSFLGLKGGATLRSRIARPIACWNSYIVS